jgi:HEAT repeat protein
MVNLLKHSNWNIRKAGIDALSKLSEQGEILNSLSLALLMKFIAELRCLIASAMLKLVDFLKDGDTKVRLATALALQELSERGKEAIYWF